MVPLIHEATIGNLPALLHAGKPLVVDFWANWCTPCHVMAPIMRNLAKEFDGRVTFAKVDVQNNNDLAEQFEIWSLPTFVFFRKGKEWYRISGVKSRQQLRKILKKLAA